MSSKDDEILPWKKLSSSDALSEPWFKVVKHKVELPSGKIVDDYFVWESPTIATVVPVTPDDKFVICQQYRYAVDKVMYQFPAGGVGKDETPEQAARRELEEETGYKALELTPMGKSAAYPTKLSGWHHLFLAKGVTADGTRQNDEDEQTRVMVVTAEELLQLIDNGEFEVADSLVAGLLALRQLGL